eukprot:jgi/Astpho2/2218/Aster-x1059
MAWSNFLITVIGVGSVFYLMKTDVRRGTTTLRQNLKHIRTWLEEEGSQAAKSGKEEAKKISDQQQPPKPPDPPKS